MTRVIAFYINLSVLLLFPSGSGFAVPGVLPSGEPPVMAEDSETLVYLQTDKGLYISSETVWFKGYVLDAHSLEPVVGSGVLYVRLVSASDGTVTAEHLIPIENGFASGYINMYSDIPVGDYYLMGLSGRPFGAGQEGNFKAMRRIRVMAAPDDGVLPAIRNLTAGKEELPGSDNSSYSVSFFAEGGHLVAGLPSVVAFHTDWKDEKRRGSPVSGQLLAGGQVVARFKSNARGYGRFGFTPDHGVDYTVLLDRPGGEARFPPVAATGITMQLTHRSDDTLHFAGTHTPDFMTDGHAYISVQYRGQSVAAQRVTLRDGTFSFRLPTVMLPEGILEVTLHDASFNPLCERLVYINPHKRLQVQAYVVDSVYDKGDKVKVHIKVRDAQGNPVQAHLGLSVWDSYYSGTDGLGIQSYAHLHTQVAMPVEDAGYYFRQTPGVSPQDIQQELDLALLTRGWRAYVWKQKDQIVGDQTEKHITLPHGYGGRVLVNSNRELPQAVFALLPDGSMNPDPIEIDRTGTFRMDAYRLYKGVDREYFYLRFLGEPEGSRRPRIVLDRPFALVDRVLEGAGIGFPYFGNPVAGQEDPKAPRTEGERVIEEVLVRAGSVRRHYSDSMVRNLDSLTKFTTDYVGTCGWLNCPQCPAEGPPVEGKVYNTYRDPTTPVHYRWTTRDRIREPYKYPVYTEEELLEKFNIYRATGFQPEKIFYEPSYTSVSDPAIGTDFRSTLLWRPAVVTDENGEAVVEFHTSSINGYYKGRIEGVDANGLLGEAAFTFYVKQ